MPVESQPGPGAVSKNRLLEIHLLADATQAEEQWMARELLRIKFDAPLRATSAVHDPYTCEKCGSQKAHSRLRGLFCLSCESRR